MDGGIDPQHVAGIQQGREVLSRSHGLGLAGHSYGCAAAVDQTGEQDVSKADMGRLALDYQLVVDPGDGPSAVANDSGEPAQLPGGRDVAFAVPGLQFDVSELGHLRDQDADLIDASRGEAASLGHVASDVVYSVCSHHAVGVVVSDGHGDGICGAAVDGAVVSRGLKGEPEQTDVSGEGVPGGPLRRRDGAADAPGEQGLSLKALGFDVHVLDLRVQASLGRYEGSGDVADVAQIEIDLDELAGRDLGDAQVGQVDEPAPELLARGIVSLEEQRDGKILVHRIKLLGLYVRTHLQYELLSADLLDPVHAEGPAKARVGRAAEIVALDEHSSPDSLEHAVVDGHVEIFGEGHGLDVDSVDGLHVAGVDAQGVEHGHVVLVDGEPHGSGGVLHGQLGHHVGVADGAGHGVVLGIAGLIGDLRVEEQVDGVVL